VKKSPKKRNQRNLKRKNLRNLKEKLKRGNQRNLKRKLLRKKQRKKSKRLKREEKSERSDIMTLLKGEEELIRRSEVDKEFSEKVKIVDVIKLIRNEAAKAGYMSPAHKAVSSFVIKTGHAVPIDDATKQLRDAVGLGELPPTTHSFPGALEEVQKIIKATEFDSLIRYNWETGEIE